MNRRNTLIFLTLALVGAGISGFVRAAETAIGGMDAVSYFSGSAPVTGAAANSVEWQGKTWLFSTPENKAAFEKAPESYAPQYGGYCAFAAAKNALAPGDPAVWTVVAGRLYLNLSEGVRQKWNADIPGHIAAADKNWPALKPN